jgi:WD40 repeat protein
MLEGNCSDVSSVVFSHDSTRLASASRDKTVKVWDSSGECLQTLKGHIDWVHSVTFSHDRTQLASASADKTVKIWDTTSGECLHTLKGHSDLVNSIIFSHDSTWLASTSSDHTVKIWNASSGECLQTLEGGYSTKSMPAVFSHDSAQLASAPKNSMVKLYDTSSGECLQTFKGHKYQIKLLAFSYSSARLASASYDEMVKIWDAINGECLQTLNMNKTLFNISFDITDSYLHTEIGTIDICAPSSSRTLEAISEPHSPRYRGLVLSSDSEWITYNSENLVRLPSEYRPSCSAVSDKTIGIGVGSEKVWMCNLELDES